jgi:two-component system, OmpR family, sensor histidine kinase VicK
LYQSDVINGISDIFYNSEHRVAICGNSRFPSLIFSFESIRKAIVDAKNRGIRQRYIFEITKENINYCKELMRMADDLQVRHSDQIEANFALNETEYLSSITMKERHQAIYSNVREIVEQEGSIFETVWNTSLPAKYRIREIQEGTESDFLEVIYDAQKARDIYIDLARSVDNEALLLFANSKALVRAERLGVVDYLIRAYKKGASIKIICPITEENSEIITQISEKAPGIRILNGGDSHSGLFIVNNAKFIRFEIKELQAEDFTDAVEFVVYSNTKVSVYSSRSFFELLWNERVQYEKLKEADEMKSEFINVAAHELRTPIQPILSLVDLIRSDMKGSTHEESLDIILRNAKRLQRLTDNILDVTKIESRSLDLKREHFNLKDVITNTLNDAIVLRKHSSNNSNKKTNIRLYYQPQDSFVEGDEGRISQVVYNLVNNAFKFSKEGSIITVNTKLEDNKIIVSVKDTGQGIDPKIFPKLFSKFEAKSFSGTGLGLYISKNIIEAHGGRMWAENNNLINGERGATFYFTLPVLNNQQNQLVS